MTTRFVGSTGLEGIVPSLRRLTFYYCEQSNSSKWLREYLLHHLVPLASATPHTEFAVSRRTNKHPIIRAEYLNGYEKVVPLCQAVTKSCKAKEERENQRIALDGPRGIKQTVQTLMDSAGLTPQRFRKQTITRVPLTETRGGLGIASPFADPPLALRDADSETPRGGPKSFKERTLVEDFGAYVREKEREALHLTRPGHHPSNTRRFVALKKQKKSTSIRGQHQ